MCISFLTERPEMSKELGNLVDNCNDSLALMGQVNYQLNLFRREQLKPELKKSYRSLCNAALPVTDLLFGEDLSKAAKEVEDRQKISNKIGFQYGRGLRKNFIRSRISRAAPYFPRVRGRGYPPYRGRGYYMPNYYSYFPYPQRKNWNKGAVKGSKGKKE